MSRAATFSVRARRCLLWLTLAFLVFLFTVAA